MTIKQLFENYIEALPTDTTLKDICEYMKGNGFRQNKDRHFQWELKFKPYASISIELESDKFRLQGLRNLLNVDKVKVDMYVQLPYKVHVSESRVIPFCEDTWYEDINNTLSELLTMNDFTSNFLINKAQNMGTADEYAEQIAQDLQAMTEECAELENENVELKGKIEELESDLLDALERIDNLEGELLEATDNE